MQLSPLEKKVSRLQQTLIDRRSNITCGLDNPLFTEYANELAAKFFPRSTNETYRNAAVELFKLDLALAPTLHRENYLWRYNYDDLDLLSNFYKFANKRCKYFHTATKTYPKPNANNFRAGLEIIKVELNDEKVNLLFDLYEAAGTRRNIAARIIESISFLPNDKVYNSQLFFAESPSKRNQFSHIRGKFRYLRKGKQFLILGTQPIGTKTKDLRQIEVEIFNYKVKVTNEKVLISVSENAIARLKSEIKEILNSESAIYFRLNKANELYKTFFETHRFANNMLWIEIDKWLVNRFARTMKAYPKMNWETFKASKNLKPPTFQPRRSNFFWNPAEELHCQFSTVWSPYNWN